MSGNYHFPGTYILILHLPEGREIQVGKLGRFTFPRGYYAYVGSAFGPGGLEGRWRHHLRKAARPHWHIDYLRAHAVIEEIWYVAGGPPREHEWAERLRRWPESRPAAPGFGASDCRCAGHLFYFPRGRPALEDFQTPGRGEKIGRFLLQ
ncbi:MAG: GIY-YIG nuclease family protein [Calditrichaeota bacterium]|nr:MAG: GIY-YIG nuclease family protein [Calditrichota bacterium]